MFLTIVTVIHIVVCAFMICIVLLQQGKGADMGATFGGGGNTLFGASGADNLLTRVTTVTAFIFMCTSVYLSMAARPNSTGRSGSLFQDIPESSSTTTEIPAPINAPVEGAAPAAPAEGAAAGAAAGAGAAASGAASGTVVKEGAASSAAPADSSNAAPAGAAAPPPAAIPPAQPSVPVDSAPPAQPGAAAH